LKRVLALLGQTVCRKGPSIAVDDIAMGEAKDRDRAGNALTVWQGCRVVGDGEKQLRREQSRLSLAGREPKAAQLPSSYVERVKADRKARARLSDRDKIRVYFVQGGAPGSAK
jgi:hypothetical protein